jgi:hypothetical protein
MNDRILTATPGGQAKITLSTRGIRLWPFGERKGKLLFYKSPYKFLSLINSSVML